MTIAKRMILLGLSLFVIALIILFIHYIASELSQVPEPSPSSASAVPTASSQQEVSSEPITPGLSTTPSKSPTATEPDRIPPEIHGAKDLLTEVGTPISYMRHVTVTDNQDREIELTVDPHQVNLNEPGTYALIYQAVDQAGNTTQIEVSVTVLTFLVDPDLVRAEARQVLDEILDDTMSSRDQAYAIYRFVHDSIKYIGHSDKSSEDNAAYDGLVRGYGDCFTYYATARLLLTEAGIQNIPVQRTVGVLSTDHYWNLINLGDGWYHFDATPRNIEFPFDGFMRTDADLATYYTDRHGHDYYTFDHSLYPATPEN